MRKYIKKWKNAFDILHELKKDIKENLRYWKKEFKLDKKKKFEWGKGFDKGAIHGNQEILEDIKDME